MGVTSSSYEQDNTRGDGSQVEQDTMGYCPLPHQLRSELARSNAKEYTKDLVYFLADLTIGWHTRFILLSHSDIRFGPMKASGERMTDLVSGIKSPNGVVAAIKEALEHGWIETRQYPGKGTAYGIHARIWALVLAVLLKHLRWEYRSSDRWMPYDPERDETLSAIKSIAGNAKREQQETQPAIETNTARYQSDSSPLSIHKQTVPNPIAASKASAQDTSGLAAFPKIRLEDTGVKDTDRKDTIAPTARAPYVAQVLPVKNEEQKELEEREDEEQQHANISPLPSVHSQASANASTSHRQEDMPPAASQTAKLTDDEVRDKQAELVGLKTRLKELLGQQQELTRKVMFAEMGQGNLREARDDKRANVHAQAETMRQIDELERLLKPYLLRQRTTIIPFPGLAGD